MNTCTISFPSTFCLWYANSNCEKRRRFWGVSRMPIDQECKTCGKTFRNKGYLYCSKNCQEMDGHWNYIEIWKCYNFRNNHHLTQIFLQKTLDSMKWNHSFYYHWCSLICLTKIAYHHHSGLLLKFQIILYRLSRTLLHIHHDYFKSSFFIPFVSISCFSDVGKSW